MTAAPNEKGGIYMSSQKMWAGRTAGETSRIADDFNSSIATDGRMYKQDIMGSLGHVAMLGKQGILSAADVSAITDGLTGILQDMESGALAIDGSCEDIHMFIESTLTERIGEAGKRLHTARSRNDQVALDIRLYLRDEVAVVRGLLFDLVDAVAGVAQANADAILPGYTHLQRAQPVTFGHHLLAYCDMLRRDIGRLDDAVRRMNVSPLGACALAGTTYPIDRAATAAALGFDAPVRNSMDAVSDRDFCVEFLSVFSLIMMHLSRFSEELLLWSSWEFSFIELSDAFTTGSSIMPQKKNADMAELVRGKTGRVYGDLIGTLTMLKGLPLAYNKDMQEDKDAVFDALDTVKACLGVFIPMIASVKVKKEAMYSAAQRGFINATDLADYLTKRGMPFRSAYKTVGTIVADCIAAGQVLDTLPLSTYKTYSPLFEEDLYDAISLETCVGKRISEGSTGPASVKAQLDNVREFLKTK